MARQAGGPPPGAFARPVEAGGLDMKSWKDDPRAATNRLFNGNRLKLGLFGLNAGHLIMSLALNRQGAGAGRGA